MNVVIFGARGNLGQDLVRIFRDAGDAVCAFDRSTVDVTDAEAIRAAVSSAPCDVVLNAAAWNNVDAAEDPANREAVWALNVRAPAAMARAAAGRGAAFVHFSTDYVFDGTKPEGYVEDDAPRPISAYGESKLAGERAVFAAGGRAFVCRTSKLFGAPGSSPGSKPSFVSVMVKLARTKPELAIVDEEVGSPTYTRDLALAARRLLDGGFASGTYHLVNDGPGVTWYGFAEEFLGLLGIATPRRPVSSGLFPKPAKRPKFAPLCNTKFPPLRTRAEALKAFFEEYPDLR